MGENVMELFAPKDVKEEFPWWFSLHPLAEAGETGKTLLEATGETKDSLLWGGRWMGPGDGAAVGSVSSGTVAIASNGDYHWVEFLMPTKEFPRESVRQMVSAFTQTGCDLVVIGGPADKEDAWAYRSAIAGQLGEVGLSVSSLHYLSPKPGESINMVAICDPQGKLHVYAAHDPSVPEP